MKLVLAVAAALSASLIGFAQGLDPAMLLKPSGDAWPTYNGDYSGRRYSDLNQIDASNVTSLGLAWAYRTNTVAVKSTPLMVDGILYFSVPDHVWAVDGRSGREIWHYRYTSSGGDHIGNRGVGMYKDRLYFETPDCHLICLNAKDGKQRWKVELGDVKLGYCSTMAPLVVANHIIVGVSGDVTDLPGYLDSRDPETGALQWRFYTAPKPGEPGSETWPKNGDAITHGGGMTWMTGTYDPALNLVYWGTGNPNPVLVGEGREGDNLYTCSIVALHGDTGKLAWYFQPSPHDVHDWDAVETPILFDGEFHGEQRQMLAQASRNGYFFLLDRKTGAHLLTAPFVESNWAQGINAAGQPVRNPAKDPAPDGVLVEPGSSGSTNWPSPSYDPQTGLVYVNARRQWSVFYKTSEGKAEGWGGRDRGLYAESVLVGIDYKTGEIRWKHEIGPGEGSAGIMTTAGNVLFTADTSGNLLGLSPSTGETLWHVNVGGHVANSPMTYRIGGKQYLIFGSGDSLYAFTLAPQRK